MLYLVGVVSQAYLDDIREMGLRYGLELNDSKLELLACDDECEIDLGNGARVKKKAGIIYLRVKKKAGIIDLGSEEES